MLSIKVEVYCKASWEIYGVVSVTRFDSFAFSVDGLRSMLVIIWLLSASFGHENGMQHLLHCIISRDMGAGAWQ